MSAMDLKTLATSIQSQLRDITAGAEPSSAVEIAVMECSKPWSRSTLVMMTPADILSVAAPGGGSGPVTSADMPTLRLKVDGGDPSRSLRVCGERHLGMLASLPADRPIPLMLSFADSPGRPDDGFWCLMVEEPRHLRGRLENAGNSVAMPNLPVSAAKVGLEQDTAVAIGAAIDAINAVASMSPRAPESSGHPAGDIAEKWADGRNSDDLVALGIDECFKRSWFIVKNNPALAVPSVSFQQAA